MHEENDSHVPSDLQWPRLTDRAFVEINPFVGAWAAPATNERLYRMIRGFYRAGDVLVAEAEAEPGQSINLLYPIIFTYRQCIELHLKYLLMAFGPWADEVPEFRRHGLVALWARCRRIIVHFEGVLEGTTKEGIEAVDGLVAEFDAVDPGSDAFRYCHDPRGRPIKLAIKAIDLANLRRVMAGLHNFLECVDYHLRHGYGVPPCAH